MVKFIIILQFKFLHVHLKKKIWFINFIQLHHQLITSQTTKCLINNFETKMKRDHKHFMRKIPQSLFTTVFFEAQLSQAGRDHWLRMLS